VLGSHPAFALRSRSDAAETDGSLRVALPRLDRLASPTRTSKFNCALGLYLRARFNEIPAITLVSEQRMTAIMEEWVSPARDQDLRDLLGSFQTFQPVDACVSYTCTGSTGRVIVQTASRRLDETFAMPRKCRWPTLSVGRPG